MGNIALTLCKLHHCHGICHRCCTCICCTCICLDTPPKKKIQTQQLRHICVILLCQHIGNFTCFRPKWSVARTTTTIWLAIFQVLTMSLAYSLRFWLLYSRLVATFLDRIHWWASVWSLLKEQNNIVQKIRCHIRAPNMYICLHLKCLAPKKDVLKEKIISCMRCENPMTITQFVSQNVWLHLSCILKVRSSLSLSLDNFFSTFGCHCIQVTCKVSCPFAIHLRSLQRHHRHGPTSLSHRMLTNPRDHGPK